jgi:hypothetical protein
MTLSRREFLGLGAAGAVALKVGGTGAAAAFLSSCTAREPVPDPAASGTIEEIIRQGIKLLKEKEYAHAQTFFGKYSHKVNTTLIDGTSKDEYVFNSAEVEFLYAMSHVPQGTLQAYNTAGERLNTVFYKIRDEPSKLEQMQQNLKPFLELKEYQDAKTFFKKNLSGRHKMFNVLLSLLEEDYTGAEKALRDAIFHLKDHERKDTFITLGVLGRNARKRGDYELSKKYDTLTEIIK